MPNLLNQAPVPLMEWDAVANLGRSFHVLGHKSLLLQEALRTSTNEASTLEAVSALNAGAGAIFPGIEAVNTLATFPLDLVPLSVCGGEVSARLVAVNHGGKGNRNSNNPAFRFAG